MGALADFRADLDRHVYMGDTSALVHLLATQGVWAAAQYRFNRWVVTTRTGTARRLLRLVGFAWYKLTQIATGIDLPGEARIGPGLYIGHFGGIIVNSDVVMGANCNLSQQVTLGVWTIDGRRGTPVVGDRVYIGPGAKVFGPVTIGDDAAIGANAVVNRDVPAHTTVGGVPAKILGDAGSAGFVSYRGQPAVAPPGAGLPQSSSA